MNPVGGYYNVEIWEQDHKSHILSQLMVRSNGCTMEISPRWQDSKQLKWPAVSQGIWEKCLTAAAARFPGHSSGTGLFPWESVIDLGIMSFVAGDRYDWYGGGLQGPGPSIVGRRSTFKRREESLDRPEAVCLQIGLAAGPFYQCASERASFPRGSLSFPAERRYSLRSETWMCAAVGIGYYQ